MTPRTHMIDWDAMIDPGVKERPPKAGYEYVAFEVHRSRPSPLAALAIAHCEGEKYVVDAIRENILIKDAAELLKRYRISEITGAVNDGEDEDEVAHAVSGVINLLHRKELQ